MTLWDAEDQSWVGHAQGKFSTCCTISLSLDIFFKFSYQSWDLPPEASEHSREALRYLHFAVVCEECMDAMNTAETLGKDCGGQMGH